MRPRPDGELGPTDVERSETHSNHPRAAETRALGVNLQLYVGPFEGGRGYAASSTYPAAAHASQYAAGGTRGS